MLSCIMGIGDFCCAEAGTRHQTVDKGRFPHTAVATEQCDLALQQRPEFFHAIALLSGDGTALIANSLIERDKHLLVIALVIIEQVGLIEDEHHWHTISLSGGEETVDKCGGCLRIIDCHDQ